MIPLLPDDLDLGVAAGENLVGRVKTPARQNETENPGIRLGIIISKCPVNFRMDRLDSSQV